MTVRSQMPELDQEGFFTPPPPPPYKLSSQNTPYKLGLNYNSEIVLILFAASTKAVIVPFR